MRWWSRSIDERSSLRRHSPMSMTMRPYCHFSPHDLASRDTRMSRRAFSCHCSEHAIILPLCNEARRAEMHRWRSLHETPSLQLCALIHRLCICCSRSIHFEIYYGPAGSLANYGSQSLRLFEYTQGLRLRNPENVSQGAVVWLYAQVPDGPNDAHGQSTLQQTLPS